MTKLSHPESLLAHLLATLGLGSAVLGMSIGCGGETTPEGPQGKGGAAGTPKDAAVDPTAEPPSTGGIPPIITEPDVGPPCKHTIVERRPLPEDDPVCPRDGSVEVRVFICLGAPSDGKSCEEGYAEACIVRSLPCSTAVGCGPLPDALGRCCYVMRGGLCPPGRPFMVEGRARMAAVGDDPSWVARLAPQIDALDAATRAALADVWTQDALAEHASVASFSRFVLQCLAVGAPADIVRDAQKACAEEIEHARIGFGLASAYGGRAVGPGPLDIRNALDGATDAVEIACSVAREGCIAETVSASLIAIARDAARDPVVKALLGRIADEEYEHALLAWRYLRWALAHGDRTLRDEVARTFARMEDHVALGARTSIAAPSGPLRAHGYLPVEERGRFAAGVLAEVIRPAVRLLLDATPPAIQIEHPDRAQIA